MARLLEAVRPDARVILVGDPEQLASVEAGAVLGDIVGPQSTSVGSPGETAPTAAIGQGIVVLRRVHRYGGAIADVAQAIQRADADAVMAILEAGPSDVRWLPSDGAQMSAEELAPVRALAVQSGRAVIESARAGRAEEAIAALAGFRLLCAHRQGPEGVASWTTVVENWLQADVAGFVTGRDWYVGRPLIVTENDYGLQLYNGDTGVVVEASDGRLVAAFERGGVIAHVSPKRAGGGGFGLRDDGPQESGVAVRHRGVAVAEPGVPGAHPRVALHGGDPSPGTPHPRRLRGVDPFRHRPADHPGLGLRAALWDQAD